MEGIMRREYTDEDYRMIVLAVIIAAAVLLSGLGVEAL
jgi:hypothetical protein